MRPTERVSETEAPMRPAEAAGVFLANLAVLLLRAAALLVLLSPVLIAAALLLP